MFLPASFSHRSLIVETLHAPILNTRSDSATCGFEGNNDIYGIGIRIGIYSQILAVWFANHFLLSEAQVLRDTVSIFSVAILIVSLIFAAEPSNIFAVEGFVIIHILNWSCIMGVRVKTSYTKGLFTNGSMLRRVTCEIIYMISRCLTVWFWWSGLDRMQPTPCGTFMLLYVVKTDMYGWARKVMMAMSLFVLICHVYWTSVDFSRPLTFWKMRKVREQFCTSVRQWERLQSGKDCSSADAIEEKKMHQDQPGQSKAAQTRISHDACSKHSCAECSPTKSTFALPLEPVITESQPEGSSVAVEEPKSPFEDCFEDTSSQACHVHTQSTYVNTGPPADFRILEEVRKSEKYIQSCISASPYQMRPDGKLLTFPIIAKSILFPKKYRTVQPGQSDPPSWLQCQTRTWSALFTFRLPAQTFAIYSHLRQSKLLDPLNGPFQTYASMAHTKSPDPSAPKPPSWSSISLASSLMLAETCVPKKVWLGWYYCALDLAIHVLVILQLELTLRWNDVSGLSDLWSSVGQLIPFVIGVSGLGLVLSRYVIRIWVKRRKGAGKTSGWEKGDGVGAEERGEGEKSESFGLERDVIEGFERWKEAFELSVKEGESK
ncbi:hypothetical protein IQ07DRAFT_671033 [Pyrenochaeta sp. DS3sAY3a]|nr:hypothetical protein IQ07DRAFT_671033 [Pyrenochaeta sp. DS3sAY3a]